MDDRIESLFGIAFALSAAASLGVGTIEIFGLTMLDTIREVGPLTIDYATVVSLSALAVAYAEIGGSTTFGRLSDIQQGAVYLALGITVYGSINPGFASDQTLVIQLALIAGTLMGYWALSHED